MTLLFSQSFSTGMGRPPTSAETCLFVSPGRLSRAIFAAAEELFGAIYCEMAEVSLYPHLRRWLDTTGDSSSTMVSRTQIV